MSDLPPNPSPLRPAAQLVRRRYQQHLLDEAIKLCHSDGVAHASQVTGVNKATLYKLLRPAAPVIRKGRASKPKPESPEKAFLKTPLYAKAKALGEMYAANVPGDSKRNAYARSAARLGIDAKLLWKAYKAELYTSK